MTYKIKYSTRHTIHNSKLQTPVKNEKYSSVWNFKCSVGIHTSIRLTVARNPTFRSTTKLTRIGGCPTFNFTPACKRDCCLGGNSAPRGKHVYYPTASDRAAQGRFNRKRCKTCQVRERKTGSSDGWRFWTDRYQSHSTPEVIIIVYRGSLSIDPSRCHTVGLLSFDT
jgi:hypothetical protein